MCDEMSGSEVDEDDVCHENPHVLVRQETLQDFCGVDDTASEMTAVTSDVMFGVEPAPGSEGQDFDQRTRIFSAALDPKVKLDPSSKPTVTESAAWFRCRTHSSTPGLSPDSVANWRNSGA